MGTWHTDHYRGFYVGTWHTYHYKGRWWLLGIPFIIEEISIFYNIAKNTKFIWPTCKVIINY